MALGLRLFPTELFRIGLSGLTATAAAESTVLESDRAGFKAHWAPTSQVLPLHHLVQPDSTEWVFTEAWFTRACAGPRWDSTSGLEV